MSNQFENYYREEFLDRWTQLRSALLEEKKHVIFLNPFLSIDEKNELIKQDQIYPIIERLNIYQSTTETISVKQTKNGLLSYYFFDLASLMPVLALKIDKNDSVLDVCASPGGKTLLIINQLDFSSKNPLVINEKSKERFIRLKNTLKEFVPKEILTNKKTVILNSDGKNFGIQSQYKNSFDKILLDAPCSSERHVLKNSKELSNWSEKRVKNLSQDQFSLICSAFDSLKPKGRLVYSTCALNRKENDKNIERLFDKRKNQFQIIEHVDDPTILIGEKTEFGRQYLPDKCGYGPIYLSVISKL